MVRRRSFTVFNLSFLDCMSCGFGSVILLFILVNANAAKNRDELTKDLRGEVNKIEVEILKLEKEKVLARNAIEDIVDETAETQGLSREIIREIEESKEELARQDGTTLATKNHVNQLKTDLLSLEQGIKRLKAGAESEDPGDSPLAITGDGRRQYLTGLQLNGNRTLILVDASASMLGEKVVDVLRIRNLPLEEQRSAPKWIQARRTVEWLLSQLPMQGEFQVVLYNEKTTALLPNKGWWSAGASELRKEVSESLAEEVPEGGTSLYQAFTYAAAMNPPPDNIILLADGLPTMGASPPGLRKRVSGARREKFFEEALRQLPGTIPVNTLLFYMEGDPMAAVSYWRLAVKSRGSFLSVTEDWP